MPDSNELFLADPKAFAKKWSLFPTVDWNSFSLDQSHIKQLALRRGGEVLQMQGTNKVRYCNIRRPANLTVPGDFMDDYGPDLNLYVMQITDAPAIASAFPVYYLHWGPDATGRMALKPSPKHPKRDGKNRVIDPDVFVTAAVQGCSIFVDGPVTAPVVYHINATSVGGEVFNAASDAAARQSAQAKVGHMRTVHERAQRQHPKHRYVRHGPRHASAEANMTQYMGDFVTPTGRAGITARHDERAWYNLWGLLGGGHTTTIQGGTVFGIRRHGEWAFYRQTRTRITYDVLEPGEAPYAPPVVRRESKWVATNCVQFWPVYRG